MSEMSRKVTPAFAAFKALVGRAVADNPALVRLDCLNPVKAVKHDFRLRPRPHTDSDGAWRAFTGIRWKANFYSHGVRASLRNLFGKFRSARWSLPADVYPVYQMLADECGAAHTSYRTLPTFDIGEALTGDFALLTYPLVPTGRDITPAEADDVFRWLAADRSRVAVIDRVYDYVRNPLIQTLIDTDRVVVLYSLSKTLLQPNVMGMTVGPDWVLDGAPRPPEPWLANALMTQYAGFPAEQQSIFRYRWSKLAGTIRAVVPDWTPPEVGYLSVANASHRALLDAGILAVPGDVYNAGPDMSVLSCLHETNAFGDAEEVERYHVTVASNFARGFDKYSRVYSKENIPESTYPDQFFVLTKPELDIGFEKASRLASKKPGDRIITLKTKVKRHELRPNLRTGLGHYVERNWIKLSGLAGDQIEDVYAESLRLNNSSLFPWDRVKPRSLSVLPIAQACQARCEFCFSHSSVSDDQKQGRVVMGVLEEVCRKAQDQGANRFVITGGGEPTLLAHGRLLELIRTGHAYFDKVVMISNGYKLGHVSEVDRLATLVDYHDAGLNVLSISRHIHDDNEAIMKVDTKSDLVAKTWSENRNLLKNLRLRWVCVLQKQGVHDEDSLENYLEWAYRSGVREVCFKELYVAATQESEYHDGGYNTWCAENQVPMSLVQDFLRYQGAKEVHRLPWGAPVYDLAWADTTIRVAVYTEPSVFWERANAICRSWNLMADGTCYANLETAASRVPLGSGRVPLEVF